jgi:hypothetical protein
MKLLGITFRNRCWPTTFHTITTKDADSWHQKWPVWSDPNLLKYIVHRGGFKLALVLWKATKCPKTQKQPNGILKWQKWESLYCYIAKNCIIMHCIFNNVVVVVVLCLWPQMVDGWALGGVFEIFVYNAASMWPNHYCTMHKYCMSNARTLLLLLSSPFPYDNSTKHCYGFEQCLDDWR